jgi:predicted DNA repair protein MutK
MPSGLVALLDDVAGITKLAAASLDDVAGAAGRAGTKAAGVVIDDTAVTPRYVTGFTPDRELPIIAKIARGSLKNKLLFLLPAAIALSALAPWAVTPLLMMGGAYLCFEATEKLVEAMLGHEADEELVEHPSDMAAIEREKVSGAIRTDFILSAEIMAIALADVADSPLLTRAIVLAVVGIVMTVAVYGVVAMIVKMDDVGLHLAKRRPAGTRAIGRLLVRGMPVVMEALSVVGTAAMLWVGGGIIVHGLEHFGLNALPDVLHHGAEAAGQAAPILSGLVEWLVIAAGSGVVGLLVGGALVAIMHVVHVVRHAHKSHSTPA